MNVNRMRGKPYQSRFRAWLPEAVALRRAGETWARIAARLSEATGEPVPLTTLYEAATRWIRRQAALDALPDPAAAVFPSPGHPPSPGLPENAKAPPARSHAAASPGPAAPAPPWDADAGDGPPPGPVIRINRHAKPTPS